MVIDSGASTCILPKEIAAAHPIHPRTSSRSYTAATKEDVTPTGERHLTIGVMNGDDYNTVWEVADVHRPLFAVSRMVHNGKRVIFDSEENGGSWVHDKARDKWIRLYERDGVYLMPVWIKPGENTKKGFHRHARTQ